MDAEAFRRLALHLPGSAESAHMSHPDFRIGKKLFATLDYPEPGWAMVKLTIAQREMLMASAPDVFSPVKGGWGKTGATLIRLAAADEQMTKTAIEMAYANLRS